MVSTRFSSLGQVPQKSTFASLRGVRPLAAALMAAVLLPACTTLPSQQIPRPC